jgi:hypothetical protein|tara:strand:- start:108 stop:551 length:444 start_codon:yes stop_codon:yes gene_type:complete
MATSNAATTYLENKLLSLIFKNNAGSFSSPGDSIYVGLATAVSNAEAGTLTEVNTSTQDANYVRRQVTAANWTLASSSTDQQTVVNAANIEYPASSGVATYTVTHAFLADAASSGNILFVGALDASKAIASGDIFRINAGNLTIELK